MAELLPCPMCGCAATFVKHSAGMPGTQGFDRWDAVACKHCRTTVGACDRRFRCRADAAAAWNRRTPDLEQVRQEAARQAMAEELRHFTAGWNAASLADHSGDANKMVHPAYCSGGCCNAEDAGTAQQGGGEVDEFSRRLTDFGVAMLHKQGERAKVLHDTLVSMYEAKEHDEWEPTEGWVDEEISQPWYDLAWKHNAYRNVSFEGDDLLSLCFTPRQFDSFCTELRSLAPQHADKDGARHEPYLCIAPVCGEQCGQCTYAISPQEQRDYARRYAFLRENDPRFGMPTGWLCFKTLDEAIDAALTTATPGDRNV